MENDKSPAIDGLLIEFYKSQYEIIKNDLLQIYNSTLSLNETLPPSMTQAIITLLPKNGKKLLRNWRPISLLCVDYKILTKIISNRLKTILDQAIFKEQTCGIPNRSVFSNLFTIRELIHHGKFKNINSYIVSMDQEKAFDKVDGEFLYKTWKNLAIQKCSLALLKESIKTQNL